MLLVGGGLAGFLAARPTLAPPQERDLVITAHKYGYDPEVVHVNRGDHVRIRLVAKDVTHGFYLEGYDLDAKARPENPTFWLRRPSTGEKYHAVEEIEFVASRTGKFRYRCSTTCGYMHPFMQGELIVSPNYLFSTSVGLSAGLVAGMLLFFRRPAAEGGS
jgi:heme/copper-type cytochrome/quinol oxidase subunit 2